MLAGIVKGCRLGLEIVFHVLHLLSRTVLSGPHDELVLKGAQNVGSLILISDGLKSTR